MKAYLLAAAMLFAGSAQAQVAVSESVDAGQTLSTAQNTAATPGGASIAAISGRLSTYLDADLYRIYISSPSTFSATLTTISDNFGGAGNLDTALSLFNASGVAVATNDDASGFTVQSALPAGNSLYKSLTAGYYYLGIALSGNDPVNTNNQLLFQRDPTGGTTAVRGAATGVNPTTLAAFNGNIDPSNGDTGSYIITLSGVTTGPSAIAAATPEPATWAMMVAGFAAAGVALRRRRLAGPALA